MSQHPSAARLYEAALQYHRAAGLTAVARLLNIPAQQVKNWDSRGVSLPGAIEAERIAKIRALWILDGEGPPCVQTLQDSEAADSASPAAARSSSGTYTLSTPDPAPERVIEHLAALLDKLPTDHQPAAAAALQAPAMAPDSAKARGAAARALHRGAGSAGLSGETAGSRRVICRVYSLPQRKP